MSVAPVSNLGQMGDRAMAKKKHKKKDKKDKKKEKKSRVTVDVPVKDLIRGIRQAAEGQLAIADVLEGLSKEILASTVSTKSKMVVLRSISVGDACECGRS